MGTALERVLLIEDEDDIRQLAQMALEMSGSIKVRPCASGKEGLAALQEFQPQLVLCDMMMPGMDGTEVLKKLQAEPRTAALPFVFLTAKAQADEIAEFLRLGATAVISKPFDPLSLSATVQRIWAKEQP